MCKLGQCKLALLLFTEFLCFFISLFLCFFQTSNARQFYHSSSSSIGLRLMQFGREVNLDNTKVDLVGQGHRSKVGVMRSKIFFMVLYKGQMSSWKLKASWVKVRGHNGQGQRSLRSRSKVTGVKCCLYLHWPPSTLACKCDVYGIFVCSVFRIDGNWKSHNINP